MDTDIAAVAELISSGQLREAAGVASSYIVMACAGGGRGLRCADRGGGAYLLGAVGRSG